MKSRRLLDRIAMPYPFRYRVRLGLSAVERNPVFHPSNYAPLYAVAVGRIVWDARADEEIRRGLDIRVRRKQELEMRRCDAYRDERILRGRSRQWTAENRSVGAEPSVPILVTENYEPGQLGWRRGSGRRAGGRSRLRRAVLVREIASGHDGLSHQAEEIRTHYRAGHRLGNPGVDSRQRAAEGLHGGEILKCRARVLPDVEVIDVGVRKIFDVPPRHVAARNHKAVRVAIGQRAQQHSAGDAENRHARAHSERDCEHRRNCEHRTLAQCARRV